MVSRKNFFTIIIMMAVLFFMFMFSQLIKENGNNYDINEYAYAQDKIPSGDAKWQPVAEMDSLDDGDFILFFGKTDSALLDAVIQWCNYTKRNFICVDTLEDYSANGIKQPEMILLDTESLKLGEECSLLLPVMELGVPVVFCNLPDADMVAASETLKEILGIQEVRKEETQIEGVHLFSGFLLGGEVIYQAKDDEKEQKRQDLDLTVPWYITASGTKNYMVGIKDENEAEREEFPSLIWRNTYKGTKVFAVSGDYMSSLAGIGILDAFVYEINPYEIYPVINAQNIIMADFPSFSAENAQEIQRLYSRTTQMTIQDVMWPSISAMAKTNDLKITCFFNPQYDYGDGIEPMTGEVVFYLQQLKELDSEAGISLKYNEDIDFSGMLLQDGAFYKSLNSQYRYQAVYFEKKDFENVKKNIGKEGLLENITTVVCKYDSEQPLVSYLNNRVTLQNATASADEYSYMDNLVDRSLQTALGYSGVVLDLHNAIWPEDSKDQWQNLYDEMSSNVKTYWSGTNGFEKTTLSESDYRVRNFLNLDYEEVRNDNTVVLNISNSEDTWFLLRTHEEEIAAVYGGEYEKLEDNAYLIHALQETVEIDLSETKLQ